LLPAIDAGIQPKLIEQCLGKIPILGVCLGMQALGHYMGADLFNLESVRHGREMNCTKIGESLLLSKLNSSFQVGLYHSWAIKNLPETLVVTAVSEEDVVMAFESMEYKVFGVQFHPESVMTPEGKKIIQSFLEFT
jgi:anthranilate synthase/aminodeoxychorismate synthase-like glutamine amidotransferase